MEPNLLYYGDNLDVLTRHVKDESVDLVYLDPPFKSNQDYNVLFAEHGTKSAAQIKAFEDTWRWDESAAQAYEETVEAGGRVSQAMIGFRSLLGTSDMLAYLSMMAPRLVALHDVLKPTGSIYLHCDPTASHYLKVLMDAVFDPRSFRNEVVWRRTGSHNSAKRYGPIHDILLFYGKSQRPYFQRIFRPYLKGHVESYFKKSDARGRYWTNALTGAGTRNGESGDPWHGYNPTDVGRHWAIPGAIVDELGIDPELSPQEKLDALDEAGFIDHPTKEGSSAMPTYRQYLADSPGMSIQDIWTYQPHTSGVLYGTSEAIDEDVRWLGKQGDVERLGYPTQKPRGLLERIIASSCPEGGVVLDPFCGCGTTVDAAQLLARQWIGIDITHLAINLIRHRLRDAYGDEIEKTYLVIGEPVTVDEAEELAKEDPYQFQWWTLGLVGARPTEQKKGADKGIDGRIYFHDEGPGGKTKQIVLSVKAGSTGVSHIRDLRGVMEREGAELGVLLTMKESTQPMRTEAAGAGFYSSPGYGTKHPRLQILTIEQLLDGKQIEYPHVTGVTFKRAPRAKPNEPDPEPLFE